MGKFILGLSLILYVGLGSSLTAQPAIAFFQPYTWEQASLRAARENKLVLVEVGTADDRIERSVMRQGELSNYLQRNVIAIRIDPATPQGQNFLPHLLLYEPPLIAFLMPYGDVLEVVSVDEVAKKTVVLREALEKAKQTAAVKKMNSRSVQFKSMPFEEALSLSDKTDRPVFVYFTADTVQACLLMEKNVLNLDEVADFYNRSFINLRIDASRENPLIHRYGVTVYPVFLYLNAKGKVIYRAEGLTSKQQVMESGRTALKKAAGITWQQLTEQEALQKASLENKPVFIYYYQPGTAHKEILRSVWTDPDVVNLFERHFVSIIREAEESYYIFLDPAGKELHRVEVGMDAGELLKEVELVRAGKGLANMEQRYRQGERSAVFLEEYMDRLGRAGKIKEAGEVAVVYFADRSWDCLQEAKYWQLFSRYARNADSKLFEEVLTHRKELYRQYGEEQVRQKIASVWIAGAENFVKDGVFDETGFKEYTRRLKKEKVEGWRQIVRNARLQAAEKTGDWRTFVDLAEEKWMEEKVSDAELYSWGVKIEQNCRDEAIRYKAARWFALAAEAMERQERITGKVKMSSYKGFFEKLVNDLVGEK